MLSKGLPLKPYRSNLKFNFWDSICQFTCFRLRFDQIYLSCPDTQRSMDTRVGIGYPKFGYPRVIPGPEPNFGYGLGWVCVWIPWVFLGWVPIKLKILGCFGYYPWIPGFSTQFDFQLWLILFCSLIRFYLQNFPNHTKHFCTSKARGKTKWDIIKIIFFTKKI